MMEFGFRRNKVLYGKPESPVCLRLATRVPTNEIVVLKVLTTSNFHKAHDFLNESWINSSLTHPNICPFLGSYFEKKGDVFVCTIVMERQATDLEELIKVKKTPFSEFWLWQWLEETVEGMAYAQEEPKNLLLTDTGHIKIGDFGLSKCLELNTSRHSLCGTFVYLSPKLKEQFNLWKTGDRSKIRHNPFKSDVYSLGITMLHLALRFIPKDDQNNLGKVVDALDYSSELKTIIKMMLEVNESFRVDFLQLRLQLPKIKAGNDPLPPAPLNPNDTMVISGSNDSSNLFLSTIDKPSCMIFNCRNPLSTDAIALACGGNHFVCSVDCAEKMIARDGFKELKCWRCKDSVQTEELKNVLKKAAVSTCSLCRRRADKRLRMWQCHHRLCRRHFIRNSHHCPLCDVPYDYQSLRRSQSRCSLF